MTLVFGLGNPEKDFKGTRHNVGFETINKLAYDFNIDINRAKFKAHSGEGMISAHKAMLIKPQTYMNLSGESVREFLAFYKLTPKDIIVIYDDIDIPLGQIRIRERGSAGTHNGMRNIVERLNTDEFPRIRIGIGEKPPRMDLGDFVLSHFKKDEMDKIIEGITKAGDAVSDILLNGVTFAMNKYNKN